MTPPPYRPKAPACSRCGRVLSDTDTHVSEWDGQRLTYYCADHDPRPTVRAAP